MQAIPVRDSDGNPVGEYRHDGTGFSDTFPFVPEPSTIVLAALGLIGLVAWGWRRGRESCRQG